MIWHLFDNKNSTWNCGLITEDQNGNYVFNPEAKVFGLVATKMRSQMVSSDSNSYNLETVTTKDSTGFTTLVINPTASASTFNYLPITTISKALTQTTISAATPDSKTVNTQTTSVTSPDNRSYTVTVPQYSVTILDYEISPRLTPTPMPTFFPTSTPSPMPTSTPNPTPTPVPVPGDTNGDGHVDGIDYVTWLNHYGTATSRRNTDGDFNYDRVVDGIDYVIWLNNYGK